MAFDTYLEIPDIPGEATGMPDTIEVYSFSWGASNPVTVGSGTGGISGGKVSISSFNIMKKTDKASAKLFLYACNGTHIPTMTLHMRKQTGEGGQADFLVYKFTEVMVESIQWSGSTGGDDTPTESVSFAFAKVEITYSKQGDDGAMAVVGESAWDLRTVKNS